LEQFSKALDTAIKAPLWFWFAMMVASGIPMFNIPNLVGIGIVADFKLFGVPLALVALLSTALFVASACARSAGVIGTVAKPVLENLAVRWSIARLDPDARAILSVLENDGLVRLYYPPDDEHLSTLRDGGFLLPDVIGDRRDWGTYHAAVKFEHSIRRYRGMVRRLLRVDQERIERVRARSAAASRAASRRI
jgi:hypothetical protein